MFKDENAIVYYISFDPFSLIDQKFKVCCGFEKGVEESNDARRLKSMSINDAISDSKISMEDLYNPASAPDKNIVELLSFLEQIETIVVDPSMSEVKLNHKVVHFLIDEFNQEILTRSYSTKLLESLKKNFEASTVVLALQSVSKDRRILSSDDQRSRFLTETLNIESSGMEIFELKTAVRMSSQLHELQQNLEHEVENCCFEAPITFKGNFIFWVDQININQRKYMFLLIFSV